MAEGIKKYSPVLGLTLSLLVGRSTGGTFQGRYFKKNEEKELHRALAKLKSNSWIEEDINLSNSVYYLDTVVNILLSNQVEDEEKLAKYFAEIVVYACRTFRRIANTQGNKLKDVSWDEVLLVSKLKVIGAFSLEFIKGKNVTPRLTHIGGRKIDDEILQDMKLSADDHLADLMHLGCVQEALNTVLALKMSNFWSVSLKDKSPLVIAKNGRKRGTASGDVLKANIILRGIIAFDRVLSNFSGQRMQLAYKGNRIIPSEIPHVFRQSLSLFSDVKGKKKQTYSVCVDSKRKRLLSVSTDGTVEIFNLSLSASEKIPSLNIAPGKHSLSFDGTDLCIGDETGNISMYDVKDNKVVRFAAHSGAINALKAYSGRLFSAGNDGFINIWDITNINKSQTLKGHSGSVNCIDSDSNCLISGGEDGMVRFWNVLSVKPRVEYEFYAKHGAITALCVDGGEVYTGGVDGCIRIWDEETYDLLYELNGAHDGSVTSICLDADRIYTAGEDGVLKAWKLSLEEVFHTSYDGIIENLAVDGSGKLYTGDKHIYAWDVEGLLDRGYDEEYTRIGGSQVGGYISNHFHNFSDRNLGADDDEDEQSFQMKDFIDKEYTLEDIIHSAGERKKFHKYLKDQYAEEGLEFWIANYKYQMIADVVSPRALQREAAKIIERFIEEDAPQEVNISSETKRNLLNRSSGEFDKNSFEDAKLVIEGLMKQNFLEEYKKVKGQYDLYRPKQKNSACI